MGIRQLTKQDARRSNQLLKRQGTANKQTGKAQLREHHTIEQAHKDDGQTSNTALKQAETEQARKWKRQL